jgi:hypothetical protein
MKARILAVLLVCVYAASAYADDRHVSKAFALRTQDYVRRDASARGAARQGGIFTPDVTDDFEAIIKKAFSGKEGRNMRRTIRESDFITPIVLRVNDVYPEGIAMTTMPPTLLARLPVLPKELVYRIIGGALVLLDIRSNVIVDFIPDAIPKVR